MIIENAIVYRDGTALEGWVRCEDGIIEQVGRGATPLEGDERIDAGGMHLLPGFVDVHVHGAMDNDTMDATPEALRTMASFFAKHGVTSFLATTWTDSRERIDAALENARACMGKQPNGATLRGVHLEGPYLNAEKGGAQNTNHIRRAFREEAVPWLNLDVIRIVSLAPEFWENHWLIEMCKERDITVSAAHTNATYDEFMTGVKAGVSHATHTFNAMSALHHRKPGAVGAALSTPTLRCELIADNIHLHPAVLRLVWYAKSFTNVVLVTDSVRAAGMPDGEYQVDERTTYVKEGVATLEDGTLAGSTLTMDRALRNFMAATDSTLVNTYEVVTQFPADAANLGDTIGSIEVGKAADFVILDDAYEVVRTIVGGETVYLRS